MIRLTTLRLGVLAAAAALALSAVPASAGGSHGSFHSGGFHHFHGHGFKHFGYSGFHSGTGFYGSKCFWKFSRSKKFKVCY